MERAKPKRAKLEADYKAGRIPSDEFLRKLQQVGSPSGGVGLFEYPVVASS